MDDLISRQAAIDAFGLSEKTRKWGGDHSGYDTMMLYEIQDTLEELPSVNPQKTGWWIPKSQYTAECSVCNHIQSTGGADLTEKALVHYALFKYCPNCGCRMVEPQESEV